jgi:hypothetical protein
LLRVVVVVMTQTMALDAVVVVRVACVQAQVFCWLKALHTQSQLVVVAQKM